nr:MAG TPA: hypothetical protein [Caudoviricetes sp.]
MVEKKTCISQIRRWRRWTKRVLINTRSIFLSSKARSRR